MRNQGSRWRVGLVVLAVLALGASACSSGSDGDGDAGAGGPSGEPKRGGTLRYGLEAETSGINPTTDRFAAAGYLMGNAVFDRLAFLDDDGMYRPYLAESITPNDDYTEWTVKLRPGITFHDGTPLTSEALEVGIQLALADPLVGLAAKPILGADRQIEVIDELTARFYMSEPNVHFPLYASTQLGMVASPTWLRAAEADPNLNQEPVGTGPFKYGSRTQDGSTTFVRNDDWWNGEVYLDAVEFIIQTDGARRADQLIAGDLDVMHTSDPKAIELLRGEDNLTLDEDERGEEGLVMINSASPPFDDVRVRRALALATPKQDFLEVYGVGITTPADSMFHPDLPYHDPSIEQEADQPEAAAELAAEFCSEKPEFCEGDRIKMRYTYSGPSVSGDLTADTFVNGWESAFVVEREQVLQDDFIVQVALGDYQAVAWRQFGTTDPDADFIFLDCRQITPTLSLNWTRNCNEETQAALLAQRSSPDKDEQIKQWKTAVRNINEDYVFIFLEHTIWQFAARPDVGGGLQSDFPEGGPKTDIGNGSHLLDQMWLDR